MGLKKCNNTDINLFIYDVEVHFETFCGSSEFYTGHSEYDKVIKNVLKQGQKSDVSKKYLKDIKYKCSVRIPLFEPNGLPSYRIQDNTCTVINGFPYIHNGDVKANGTILHQNYEFTGELKNYFYKGVHVPYEYIMPAKDIEDMSD